MKEIKAIGFDWDGTLLDSIFTKAKAFSESIIKYYPQLKDKSDAISSLYMATRGTLRLSQIKLVEKIYNLTGISNYDEWSSLFTKIYNEHQYNMMPDALEVLDYLKKKYIVFISSSVPQNDLNDTVIKYNIDIEDILGTRDNGKFRKGRPHFEYIKNKYNLAFGEMAFVGDGSEDVIRANDVGLFSIGLADKRNNLSYDELKSSNPDLLITGIIELKKYF